MHDQGLTADPNLTYPDTTPLCSIAIGETMEEAIRLRNGFLSARGLDWDSLDEATRAMLSARMIIGDADAVGGRGSVT